MVNILSSPSKFLYASLRKAAHNNLSYRLLVVLTFSKQLNMQKHYITIFSEMQGLPFQLNSSSQSYLSPCRFNDLAS